MDVQAGYKQDRSRIQASYQAGSKALDDNVMMTSNPYLSLKILIRSVFLPLLILMK
jgi:hypothetical protein